MMKRIFISILAVAGIAIVAFCVAYYDSVIEHGDRSQLGMDISNAMERAGGPDYQEVIRLHQQMRYYTEDERTFKVATTIICSCEAKRPPCVETPAQTRTVAIADVERLAKVASDVELRLRASDYLARINAPSAR